MNEKLAEGQEMLSAGFSHREVISVILEHMLETRPKEEVSFRPFQACRYVGYTRALSSQEIRLGDMYPEADPGDGVFVEFRIMCCRDEEIYLNISPWVKVWYNGTCIYDGLGGRADTGGPAERGVEAETNGTAETDKTAERNGKAETGRTAEANGIPQGNGGKGDMVHLPVPVKSLGNNNVRILCVKREGAAFRFEFLLSVKRYPSMWANDYLFWARAVLPIPGRSGEEGAAVSRLYRASEKGILMAGGGAEPVWQWPPALSEDETFDFDVLCGEGDICYVYTEAVRTHVLSFWGNAEYVYVNGEKAWRAGKEGLLGNQPARDARDRKNILEVKTGDKLLFRCRRSQAGWKLGMDTGGLSLPFLSSERVKGDRAVYLGPFYGTQCHGPEYGWDFTQVFTNQKGKRLYWGFCDGSELRIYLDSIFYGQWFYALMVGFYGIRAAARFLEDGERQRLFVENMCFMAGYFDYIRYDIEKHVMPAFMPRLYEMNVLDNIGTMGMNFIDAYLDSSERALLPVIGRIRRQMEETIPRLEDGTYYRLDTMWADDLYMSCPFLVRLGRLTGDVSWYEKAKAQIQGFRRRLYMEEEGVFSHIYFPGKGRANHVPWGRGNGWVMWTLSELLMYGEEESGRNSGGGEEANASFSADGKGRCGLDDTDEMGIQRLIHGKSKMELSAEKRLFQRMADSIRALQDESGLWHQVLNRKDADSYPETSCTGMFLLSFTRGVKYGWLGEDFLECMERAWRGLLAHSIDRKGNVYGVCMGSGCHMEAEYYFTIPTIINDDHGTGVILAAGAEYCALLEERKA